MSQIESYLNITIRVSKAQAEAALTALRGQVGSLSSALRNGGTLNTDNSVKATQRLTASLRSAGYALTATFTAPILAAGSSLLKFTLQNETAMADLKKVYGTNPLADYSKDIDALSKAFEALSSEFGVNQTQVIQIGAAWAAAGVQGAALAQSVQNTLKAMVIGDLSSTDATTALISIQGQYGASAADLTKILNDLNVVENITAISMGGLIQGFQRAAGAAASGGVSYRELAALLASITPYAGTAAQAGNSLKTIISNLEAPSAAAAKALELIGINIADTGYKSATATDKLKDVAAAFEKLSSAQKNVIARQLSGAFQVSRFDVLLDDIAKSLNPATEGMSRFGKAMDATRDPAVNAMVAQKELQTVLDSNPKKLQIIGNMIKNDLADALVKIMPLILQIAGAVGALVTWFSNLNPWIQQAVGYFLLLLAALGPVLLYLSALRDMARFTGDAFTFFMKPLKLVPAALALLLSPLKGVIALFGLLGGVFAGTSTAVASGAIEVETSTSAIMLAMLSMSAETQATVTEIGASLVAITEAMAATLREMLVVMQAILARMTVASAAAAADWAATWGFIYDETVVGMTAMLSATEGGLVLWNAEFAAAQARNTIIVEEGFLAQTAATRTGMLAIEGETAAGAGAARAGLLSRFISIPGKILAFFVGLGPMIARAFMAIVPALEGIGGAIVAALTSPIGIAIAAAVLIFALFRKQIIDGWNNMVQWFANGAGGLAPALAPIGNIFHALVDGVIEGFNALPEGVQGALQAVVDTVASAAKAVYSWFSYLNPWAHHSPSLVENVTSGMAAVAAQFATLNDISVPINKAYADIQRFGSVVAALAAKSQTITVNTDVASIRKAGGGNAGVNAYLTQTADVTALTAKQDALNGAMNNQQKIVDGLNDSLDKMNAQLTAQNNILTTLQAKQTAASDGMTKAQASITDFTQMGITGQKALSDAIFASQQQEASLQLQMMKIEDVTGPIADVQSKMDTLSGTMDALRGTAKSLRDAGASGDITGVYDGQVAALQGQYDGLKNNVTQYDALNAALIAAQRNTQELQLQDQLTYDPLIRQIQDAANGMKELPFDTIIKGIKDSQASLASYTTQYNTATAAVDAQKAVIDSLTAVRDALQSRYDSENAKLDTLKKSYQSVGQAISDINDQLQKMTQAASAVNTATDAAAKAGSMSNVEKNFNAAAGGNFPSAVGTGSLNDGKTGDVTGIQAVTDAAIANLKKSLAGLNPFEIIKGKWADFKTWWNEKIGPEFSQLWDNLFGRSRVIHLFDGKKPVDEFVTNTGIIRKAWDDLTSHFGKGSVISTAFSMIARQVGFLFNLFKPDYIRLWNGLVKAFDDIGTKVGPKVGPLLASIGRLVVVLWPGIKLLAGIIGVVLVGALKIIGDIVFRVFITSLRAAIAIVGETLKILTGLIDFITGVFSGNWSLAWEGIKEIFSGTLSAIWDIIKLFGQTIWDVFAGIIDGIIGFFEYLYDVLVGHSIVPDLVNAIVKWFTNLPIWVLKALASFGKALFKLFTEALNLAWTGLKNVWSTIFGWVTTLASSFLKAAGNFATTLYNWAAAGFNAAWNAFKSVWSTIFGWLATIAGSALKALGDIGTKIFNWAKAGFTRMLDGFVNIFSGAVGVTHWLSQIPNWIIIALGDVSNLLFTAGDAIITGLIRGMGDIAKRVGGAIKDGLGSGISTVKGWLGIKSPSVLMAQQVGGPISQGIAVGINAQSESVLTSMKNIGNLVTGYKFPSASAPVVTSLPGVSAFIGKSAVTAATPISGAPATTTTTSTDNSSNDHSKHITIEKVEFPNVTTSADAQDLLDSLEALTNGSRND